MRSLRQAIKMGSVKGIKADAKMNFECRVCLQGKMGRTPFPKFSERATAQDDIIHFDLCGPMRVAFLGGKLFEPKDQVSPKFEKFRAPECTQRGET